MNQIIIGVPGTWEAQSDIAQAVASSSGYRLKDGLLVNTNTQQSYKLEVGKHNPQLREEFHIASRGAISKADMAAISEHTFTLYALSAGTSLARIREMLAVGDALLSAGGVAVSVESAGIAFSAQRWRQLAASKDLRDVYDAFVTLLEDKGVFYLRGMHNFGLPACAVVADLSPEAAAELLNAFNIYQLSQSPVLATGSTFSLGEDAPQYELTKGEDKRYPPDDPFHNPHGVWILRPERKKGFLRNLL